MDLSFGKPTEVQPEETTDNFKIWTDISTTGCTFADRRLLAIVSSEVGP